MIPGGVWITSLRPERNRHKSKRLLRKQDRGLFHSCSLWEINELSTGVLFVGHVSDKRREFYCTADSSFHNQYCYPKRQCYTDLVAHFDKGPHLLIERLL